MFQADFFNEITNKLLNRLKSRLDSIYYEMLYQSLLKLYPSFHILEYNGEIDIEEFINISSTINEKCHSRKDLGKYYTPKDLCHFMLSEMTSNNFSENKKIIDPTCGNSEFLISYIDHIFKNKNVSHYELENLSQNIYGNDNNTLAVQISKVRVFFKLLSYLHEISEINFSLLVKNIDNNFTQFDSVTELNQLNVKFDFVIGNPPYVENKGRYNEIKNYGNLYANILENSLYLLNQSGKLCFIIPISYTSTPRMNKLRKVVKDNTNWSKLFHFSDRPSSLFTSVHQKLTILVCGKTRDTNEYKTFSSTYNFWYKNERTGMLNYIPTIEVEQFEHFIPKIGNQIEKKIFEKIHTCNESVSLYNYMNHDNSESRLYLNMRLTFWTKCFLDFPRSKEYKTFTLDPKYQKYLFCILSSSLFFWFWCVVSDGWHITKKELNSFLFLEPNDYAIWDSLSLELINDLEKNKKFVNTKQVDFIYQHKDSKHIIDKIDDNLSKIYHLSEDEVRFIKQYAFKYRMSLGENFDCN